MKTRLIFLVLLIVCFSCGTNNKPISDAQKEKIKGEVKEIVNSFNKGCEEVNPELLIPFYLNSPDFIYMSNGKIFNYQESIDTTKILFSTLLNQEGTIVSEKYVVLDNTTVVFTENTKWLMNFKDGHSVMQDPWIMQILLKKIDGKWKIVSGNESGVEKSVKNAEKSKYLNQVELHKQFVGTWKHEGGKDSTELFEIKPYGTGFEGLMRFITNGKVYYEVKRLAGYDEDLDKYIFVSVGKGENVWLVAEWFISSNKVEVVNYSDISNPDKASQKYEVEFKSHDTWVETSIVDNKPVWSVNFIRIK